MASSGWQGEVTLTDGGFGYDYFKGDLRVDSISHSGGTVTVTGVFGVKNKYPEAAAIRTTFIQLLLGLQGETMLLLLQLISISIMETLLPQM